MDAVTFAINIIVLVFMIWGASLLLGMLELPAQIRQIVMALFALIAIVFLFRLFNGMPLIILR